MNSVVATNIDLPRQSVHLPLASAFVDDIREVLHRWQSQGKKVALLTLVNFEGSSPRPVGSQIVVSSDGDSAGLISGGCLESALVEEALLALEDGESRVVRYGRDSDYMDIRLPCGSGLDILIVPHPERDWVNALYCAYQERRNVCWELDLRSKAVSVVPDRTPPQLKVSSPQLTRAQVAENLIHYSRTYTPRTRLVIVGDGVIFDYFQTMAQLFDMELLTYSSLRCETEDIDPAEFDSQTAFVSLSHDHENEALILNQVLKSNAFYISALGSRATHARRLEQLRCLNWEDDELKRIKGPAGLDLGGKTPPEIALSIMAEIIERKNQSFQTS